MMPNDWTPKRKRIAFEFGATDTVKQNEFYLIGMLYSYSVVIPNWSNNVTATITITDNDGATVWETTDLARGINKPILLNCPLSFDGKKYNAKITLSNQPGSSGTVWLTLHFTGRDESGF